MMRDFFRHVQLAASQLNVVLDIDESGEFGRLLSNDGRKYLVLPSRFPLNSAVAARAAGDKWITRRVLVDEDIAVPKGYLFRGREPWSEVFSRFEDLGGNVIVKPRHGEQGRYVFHCCTHGQLAFSVASVFSRSPDLILEEMLEGREFRVMVLDNRPLMVLERFPFEVCGDGRRTYIELLMAACPGFWRVLKDPRLRRPAGALDFDCVLPRGETRRPFHVANTFGARIEVQSNQEYAHVVELAILATRAVGLRYAGVDIIEDCVSQQPRVIEVNSAPAIEVGDSEAVEICKALIAATFV
jgi:glutathione synthase/RimK-type ligase-like ATP-grasp enzyme